MGRQPYAAITDAEKLMLGGSKCFAKAPARDRCVRAILLACIDKCSPVNSKHCFSVHFTTTILVHEASSNIAVPRLHRIIYRIISLCRERLWRLFVEDIKLERDDPAAASKRGRVSIAGT